MKWTDEDVVPANRRPNNDVRAMVEMLAEQPGRWAEVDRYPANRTKSAWSRGSQTVKRYPILEYAVHRQGDESVLFFRVPA